MGLATALLASAMAVAAPPQATAAPVWAGGALEVQADGRVAPLGRPHDLLLGDSKAGPAVVERVDLVWGCRGDRARAQLFEGVPRFGSDARDACALRVDVRPPCAPDDDVEGMDEADQRALRVAALEAHQAALAAHRRLSAGLAAGFSEWGPGLRLLVSAGGPLWLTSSRLGMESCDCDGATARALGDEEILLTLPRLAGPTVVWVRVPRYLGALHRLGASKAPASGTLAFTEPFHAIDDSLETSFAQPAEGSGATAEVFSAPPGCDCAPCDTR